MAFQNLKVDQEYQDWRGRYWMKFPTKNLRDVEDWLWHNYGGQGYKFAILIDVAGDEYPFNDKIESKNTFVCFLDEVHKDLVAYDNDCWERFCNKKKCPNRERWV